jgi:hypothetical protein
MKKNVLFIGLNYHEYTRAIVDEIRRLGHDVTYHDIQPGHFDLKVYRKFFPDTYPQKLDQYHQGILAAESGKNYDLVLFLQTHQVQPATMQRIRNAFAGAEFVLYNWDAVTNHDYRPYMRFFDRIYTFDPEDASALGIKYLPLFCIRNFLGLQRRCKSQSTYFVGNVVNPRRYAAVQAFKQYCADEDIDFQYFLSSSTHGYTQIIKNGHWPRDVSLRSIPAARFRDMIETSNAVFDFANHQQAGYTMRVIENLCAGKKLITNNPRIVHESFYSEDRIHVFGGHDFSGVKAFLERPLQRPQETFPAFHVDAFARKLMDGPIGFARA